MTNGSKKQAASQSQLACVEFQPLGAPIDEKFEWELWERAFNALVDARGFGEMGHQQVAEEMRRLQADKHDPQELIDIFDNCSRRLKTAIDSFETARHRLQCGMARAAVA